MKVKEGRVPFNVPHMTGKELSYIAQSHFEGRLAGDGPFTDRCHAWIERRTSATKVLLTHSCTGALEMAAILLDIQPGDEIIMPSYTFVSTANAFVLRGGIPVFVDIREDTLNIDESLIEAEITERTKAIVPVHYAGVSCEMDTIMQLANSYGLRVVEDAAQGIMASYKGVQLGSIGDVGTYSFHETKNIISGEGGALLINAPRFIARAEMIREKGTDRSSFFRGEIDKYTWQEAGSSYLPGELIAAFLWAQLESAEDIMRVRLESWEYYHQIMQPLEETGLLRRPTIPDYCVHNGHMYYVILPPEVDRQQMLGELKKQGIYAMFHYVPLHSSPAGKHYGQVKGDLAVTENISARLIRLPLWHGISPSQQNRVLDGLKTAIEKQMVSR